MGVSPELFAKLISILKSDDEGRSIVEICKSIGIDTADLTDAQIKEVNTNFIRCARSGKWKAIGKTLISEDMFNRILIDIEGTDKPLSIICENLGVSSDDLTTEQLNKIRSTYTRCARCAGWKNINNLEKPTKVCKECYKHGTWSK